VNKTKRDKIVKRIVKQRKDFITYKQHAKNILFFFIIAKSEKKYLLLSFNIT